MSVIASQCHAFEHPQRTSRPWLKRRKIITVNNETPNWISRSKAALSLFLPPFLPPPWWVQQQKIVHGSELLLRRPKLHNVQVLSLLSIHSRAYKRSFSFIFYHLSFSLCVGNCSKLHVCFLDLISDPIFFKSCLLSSPICNVSVYGGFMTE